MPSPRAAIKLLMPHPRDWHLSKCPVVARGGGWAPLELIDALRRSCIYSHQAHPPTNGPDGPRYTRENRPAALRVGTGGHERIENGFPVSKETVVLRPWERWKQKFGFIKRVDKGRNTTVKDLESWCFERQLFVRANRRIVADVGFYEGVEEIFFHQW